MCERCSASARRVASLIRSRIVERPGINALISVDVDEGAALGRLAVSRHRAHVRELTKPQQVVVVKDNIAVAGMPWTCGSGRRATQVATEDAVVVQRLRASGCWIVGKSNLDEYSFGASGNNDHFGGIANPLCEDRTPGGSSGGSAAAVAAGFCGAAIGSDTGGSLRIPAALTGTVAFRPAVGVVPTQGMWAGGPSFDTIGAIARNVQECRDLSMVLSGIALPFSAGRRLRLGIVSGYLLDAADEDVRLAVQAASVTLSQIGSVTTVDLPHAAAAVEALGIITRHEAFRAHEETLQRDPEQFGSEVLARLRSGGGVTMSQLADARKVQSLWQSTLADVFHHVDVVIGPTVPCVAPMRRTGEMIAQTARLTTFTAPWSLAGLPVIAIPCGEGEGGLPVSLQLVGSRGMESALFDLAGTFEHATKTRSDPSMTAAIQGFPAAMT